VQVFLEKFFMLFKDFIIYRVDYQSKKTAILLLCNVTVLNYLNIVPNGCLPVKRRTLFF